MHLSQHILSFSVKGQLTRTSEGLARMAREDSELAAKKTFAQLKPICVDVLRSLSVETLGRLDETLRRLHHLTPPLVEYVLFPLRMGIRRLGG